MPEAFDVVRAQDGALVICGVDLETAQDERHRLNAEARVQDPERPDLPQRGMWMGARVSYEVRAQGSDLTVAG